MDVNIPPMAGWRVFQQTEAPTKHWILFKKYTHNGYYGKILDDVFNEIVREDSPCYSKLLKSNDNQSRRDWSMSARPDLAQIWNYITPSSTVLEDDRNIDREANIPRYENYTRAIDELLE